VRGCAACAEQLYDSTIQAGQALRSAEKTLLSNAPRSCEHLIIGGGLAGAMTGLRLAAAGRDVTLLERERAAHHKVCGEFLSREAVEYLKMAEINPIALGARAIRFVRLAAGRRLVEAKLPFTALSLSRCVIDEALLKRAAQQGCNVVRGAAVECLEERDGLWQVRLRGEERWGAATIFLANGKHDLRGHERSEGLHGDLVGFKMHWRLGQPQTEALRDFMELFLFSGGYGGLSLVEGDAANFCFVVRRDVLRKTGGWAELLAMIQGENPHIAQRLSSATPLWERPLAVSAIPYGYLTASPAGLWRVGDQAAVIPSFTGDGMSIALHSGALAAQMYLEGATANAYHEKLRADIKQGMNLAVALSWAMVSRAGRRLAPIGLSIFPGAMGWIARSTRIPSVALLHSR
jgi:flavin-dependent dehydrogenase